MVYDFRVLVEDSNGRWRPILYTNDREIAVLTADTREAHIAARVIDADDNVIHRHDADESLDVGQPLAGL